ncbi:hypothetical protein D770_25735 [Flammeovirgaceae bacterium 311]|nr:hypothetical protein D770_25735 [Flammeovirgaceae bacterium 311]
MFLEKKFFMEPIATIVANIKDKPYCLEYYGKKIKKKVQATNYPLERIATFVQWPISLCTLIFLQATI